MAKKKITVTLYICERCEHEWIPRLKGEEPRICPACKSPYYDRPKREKISEKKVARGKKAK